jgi:hypothetical protein
VEQGVLGVAVAAAAEEVGRQLLLHSLAQVVQGREVVEVEVAVVEEEPKEGKDQSGRRVVLARIHSQQFPPLLHQHLQRPQRVHQQQQQRRLLLQVPRSSQLGEP